MRPLTLRLGLFFLFVACGDDTGAGGGSATLSSTSAATTSGAMVTGSTSGGPTSSGTGSNATACADLPGEIDGATLCRDEPVRCTLELPPGESCDATCSRIQRRCLRTYPRADACVPAVWLEELACDATPGDASFCQCGDPDAAHPAQVVVTIGDSTMSNGTQGESGWGDELPLFAVRPDDIHNEGSSGASSLDFETRANWPRARDLLGPDVYLFIQFGHNDTSSDPARHTEPGDPPDYMGTYRERLAFYVAAAEEAGAIPVILTSLNTMDFDADGNVVDGYAHAYAEAARAYARDEGLMLLDAERASQGEFQRLGQAATLDLYSYDETTHFTPEGARRMAELTVRLACVENEDLCAQFVLP